MKFEKCSGKRRTAVETGIVLALTALLLGGCGGGGAGTDAATAATGMLGQTPPAAQNTASANLPAPNPSTGRAPVLPPQAVVTPIAIPPKTTPPPVVAPAPIVIPPKVIPPPIVMPAPIVIPPIVAPPPVVMPAPIVIPPKVVPPAVVMPAPIVIPPIVAPAPVVIPPAVAPAFSGYVVKGNTIYDKSTGKSHLFRGVASPSMDWGVYCENCSADQFLLMRRDWNVNVVRLSINQAFWLKNSPQYSAAYAPELARVVSAIEKAGMDVILDSHRSSTGYMADAHSVVFWKEVATVYKDDPHVLFELFNEPHGISWDVWLNGGVAPNGGILHGMQELYNTVRATGAKNLVVVGGLNWAYELAGVPAHRVVGNNIVYATHPYNYPGKQPNDWDRAFGALAATDPIIATEFGNYDCSAGYYQAFVDYAQAKNISWTAWAWYPGGCGFPGIITDSKGTPNAPGAVVKAALWQVPR